MWALKDWHLNLWTQHRQPHSSQGRKGFQSLLTEVSATGAVIAELANAKAMKVTKEVFMVIISEGDVFGMIEKF